VSDIIKSLTITLLVSTSLAFVGWYFYAMDFTKWLVGSIILQVIFFAIYNNLKAFIYDTGFEAEYTKQLIEYSKQGVEAPCAGCGAPNYVPIRLDDSNDFECNTCSKPNAIYITLTTAQKTQMMDGSRLNVNSMITNELDEARKKMLDGDS
jgi:hypothetical protein